MSILTGYVAPHHSHSRIYYYNCLSSVCVISVSDGTKYILGLIACSYHNVIAEGWGSIIIIVSVGIGLNWCFPCMHVATFHYGPAGLAGRCLVRELGPRPSLLHARL